ncbi:hypothetical protein QBZ16_000362 [Prototheca wickerhamii]|uniref:U-box domain-containing protein n=1 Tax=Prototheca wickerhamii TaxID=3111 RepID=A0AAD9IL05_PROWI|nr:hypothetical protein QBZ16_000362 [Prototheca wickerhamii]
MPQEAPAINELEISDAEDAVSAEEEPEPREGDAERSDDEEEEEIPSAFQDPINFNLMRDPVVLVQTGAVYDRQSITAWLETGSTRCPKTNMELQHVELEPTPILRELIREWAAAHNIAPPDADPEDTQPLSREEALLIDPELPDTLNMLRGGSLSARGRAAAHLNNALIGWSEGGGRAAPELADLRRRCFLEVMDGLIWLVRHGDAFGAGVAASALSQADTQYAAHSAARLVAVARDVAPAAVLRRVVETSGVPCLLEQLEPEFPYLRCSAAQALAVLLSDPVAVVQLRARPRGVARLAALVAGASGDEALPAASAATRDTRPATPPTPCWWPEELRQHLLEFAARKTIPPLPPGFDAQTALSPDSLAKLRDCSSAWLRLEVDDPQARKEEDSGEDSEEDEWTTDDGGDDNDEGAAPGPVADDQQAQPA